MVRTTWARRGCQPAHVTASSMHTVASWRAKLVHRGQFGVYDRRILNPTFTIVALALRLADHLKRTLIV